MSLIGRKGESVLQTDREFNDEAALPGPLIPGEAGSHEVAGAVSLILRVAGGRSAIPNDLYSFFEGCTFK